jgi:hypothetical protein
MKKLLLFFALSVFSISAKSQSKILFEYDVAGNQIKRELCISNCAALGRTIEDISQLQATDYIKSFPEDVISYYPNPVKEELYLKWEMKDNNKVTAIQLYSLSGQLLKSIPKLENQTNYTFPFQPYAQGNYLLLLLYSAGDPKSIQIIKN